jgi:hypothetical protein
LHNSAIFANSVACGGGDVVCTAVVHAFYFCPVGVDLVLDDSHFSNKFNSNLAK